MSLFKALSDTLQSNFSGNAQPDTSGVFKAIATTSPKYFYAKTDSQGGAIGYSQNENDTSGRPFFAFREPGDSSTTTDKTRVATTFDPRVAKPLTHDEYYNPRAVNLRAKMKDELGIAYSDELDHAIALALSGSNDTSNLRAIPKEQNREAGTLESRLAREVASGSKSLFDAQVEDAKAKGLNIPYTGKPGELGPNTAIWNHLKGAMTFLGNFGQAAGETVGGIEKGIYEQFTRPSIDEQKVEAALGPPKNPVEKYIALPIYKGILRALHPGLQPFASDVAEIKAVTEKNGIYDQVLAGKLPPSIMDEFAVLQKTNPQIVGDVAQAVLSAYAGGAAEGSAAKFASSPAARAIYEGAKTQGVIGTLFGVGQAASSGSKDPAEIAKIIATNGVVGGVLGGILSGALPVTHEAFMKASKVKDYLNALPGGEGGFVKNPLAGDGSTEKAPLNIDSPEIKAKIEEAKAEAAKIPQTHKIDTPERDQLRQQIADEIYGTGAPKKEGRIDLVMGNPASGKSSLIADPLAKENGSIIIDSDMVKEKLPEYLNGVGAGAIHDESSLVAEHMILDRATTNRDNIVLPIIGKDETKLTALVNKLKDKGYDVHLHYNDLPIEKSKARAVQRYLDTGRFVDPAYIDTIGLKPLENYAKLKSNVKTYTKYNADVSQGQGPQVVETNAPGRRVGASEVGSKRQVAPSGHRQVDTTKEATPQKGLAVRKEQAPSQQTPPSTREVALSPSKLRENVSYIKDTTKLADSKLNVDNLDISPEGKALVEKTVEDVKSMIEEHVGSKLSNSEAIKLARDSSKIIERAVSRESTAKWEGAMLRARQALSKAAETGVVDKDFVDALITVKTQGTDIARKLQSFSIGAKPEDITGKQAIIEAVLKVAKNADEVVKAAQGVDFTNLDEATAFYRKFVAPKLGEWVDLIRYNSMLSSPTTHIINAFSNVINSTVVPIAEKVVAGGLDFLGSAITGKSQKIFAGEALAYARAYLKNLGDASHRFMDVMHGKRVFTNLDTKSLPIAVSGAKGKVVKALSLPLRLLEGMDQFFTALTESGSLGALKYRISKGGKVGSPELEAIKEAEYRVYRQGLNEKTQGHLLGAIDEFTKKLQGLRSSDNPIVSTIAKFTVPFLRTPMNIFKQGIEYSPVGLATLPGAENKITQLSKAMIGSSVFAGAATLLTSGRLSWAEPVNAEQKAQFRADGKLPYSIKVGNKWLSYQKLPPPMAFPFAMVAAIDDTLKNKKIDDNTVDMVLTSVAKYGQFLSDQSYMKSIGDLLTAFKGGESSIEQLVSNYPQQLIPYRALSGWLARLTDQTQRKIDNKASFIDKQVQLLMMNIPGLSQQVPARLSPTGEPIKQPDPLINAISPVKVSTEKTGSTGATLPPLPKLPKLKIPASSPLESNTQALPRLPVRAKI